jgi:hypothetical protein
VGARLRMCSAILFSWWPRRVKKVQGPRQSSYQTRKRTPPAQKWHQFCAGRWVDSCHNASRKVSRWSSHSLSSRGARQSWQARSNPVTGRCDYHSGTTTRDTGDKDREGDVYVRADR